MSSFFLFLLKIADSVWGILCSSSVWLIFSFIIAGIAHEFVRPELLKRTTVGSKSIKGIILTTLFGMLLPICSCGTASLGILMYYSGAYIGPALAFMTSTPMINPIALTLIYGLMGKKIAAVYLMTGLVVPVIVGMLANRFSGKKFCFDVLKGQVGLSDTEDREITSGNGRDLIKPEPEDRPSLTERILKGLRWSGVIYSPLISKYTVSGILLAGIILSIVPQSFIQSYLSNPEYVTPAGIVAVAALMYVCAVVHIPFIAAVVAAGAAPGVAVTFLMAGAATNIPELVTIAKTMGRRAALLYSVPVTILSVAVGYIADIMLGKDFSAVPDYEVTKSTIANANMLIIDFPDWLQGTCSVIILGLALLGLKKTVLRMHKG